VSFENGFIFAPKNECKMYAIDWQAECPNAFNTEELNECFGEINVTESLEIECENGYESVFDKSLFTSTVVTEYQLVCSNLWKDTVISTMFMAGLFFGVSIFGPVMDRFGRLNAIFIASSCLAAVQLPLTIVPTSATGPIDNSGQFLKNSYLLYSFPEWFTSIKFQLVEVVNMSLTVTWFF
jgi:hypothetical protein